MATVLQIVSPTDLSTVLFDLHAPTGIGNLGGVRTEVAIGGAFGLGVAEPEQVIVSPPSTDGGFVVSSRSGLVVASWLQYIRAPEGASSPDTLIAGVGELGRLLDAGGTLRYVANNSAEVRFIDFEPSPTPALYRGEALELFQLTQLFAANNGIPIQILRQPFSYASELNPATNLAANPTLTHDFDGTANRPDLWTGDGSWATGLSAEAIVQVETGGVRRGVYRFTKANGTAANLQQTTGVGSYAPGDVGVFSFYARVLAVAGTPQMRATLQFKQSDGTTNVGSIHNGGLVMLTTAWQRISVVSSAAGALTSRAQVSIQIDNVDGTAVTVEICNAQPQKTALSPFRVPGAAVAYNPTSAFPRKIAVWGEGNAPSPAKLKITADSLTLSRYRVYRVARRAIAILQATLHRSLRSGTLGDDTTSVADSDCIDGNCAQVAYATPNPAFGTDATASGSSSTTITLSSPASLGVGDCLLAAIWYKSGRAQLIAPDGWQQAVTPVLNTGGQGGGSILYVWVKIADADDVTAGSFTFEVAYQALGGQDYRGWIGRFTNIDPDDPIESVQAAIEATGTAPTLLSLSTTVDNTMIVGFVAGQSVVGSGTLTFTAPPGATPTYTEQDDGNTGVTWQAMAVYTGLLAAFGSTGDKDATASISIASQTVHIALRTAVAILEPRSTVTYAGSGAAALPPGEYDLWLRYRTTAACVDRIRAEYGHKASPSTWIALPDFILDTRGASTFSEYQEHLMGRLAIPDDMPLDTLTVRISAGRVSQSGANLRLDCVYLAPAFERVGHLSAPTLVTNGEHLYSDPGTGRVLHLASDSDQSEVARCEGTVPIELEPGFQVLVIWPTVLPLVGFVDPATEVTSAPSAAVTSEPRYRI